MADIHFEETCPCGDTMKVYGYTSEVRAQIQFWHTTHNKHMNAIAKAIAENKVRPAYFAWPQSNGTDGSLISNTGMPTTEAAKQE